MRALVAAAVGAVALVLLGAWLVLRPSPADVRIGSKAFSESVVLGEMLRLLAEREGLAVAHERGLGGTRIVFDALKRGEIDAYVEYTGTLLREIFGARALESEAALREALVEDGLVLGPRLGFDNTYAIGMRRAAAEARGIRRIGDLAGHPDLVYAFSHEFLERADCWPGLVARYRIEARDVSGAEHQIAYEALLAGQVDATDFYSTDGKVANPALVTLEDDLGFFPEYEAVLLYRADLAVRHPEALEAWARLAGAIDVPTMVSLNKEAELEKRDEGEIAAGFVAGTLRVPVGHEAESVAARLARQTLEHLALVAVSLLAAVVLGVSLGVIAARVPRAEPAILGTVGVAQTIPSLAFLAFLVPFLGMGATPAILALLVYSLLPIVRNTHAGLRDIPPALRESAEVLGLGSRDVLWRIELPLAAGPILAGVKTAAVINVGTATLGGLIGAGGYGDSIFAGLRAFDTGLLLQGAGAAMVLAVAVDRGFALLERRLVPGARSGAGRPRGGIVPSGGPP